MEVPGSRSTQTERTTRGAQTARGSSASTPDMASTLADHLAAHDEEMRRISAELDAIRALKASLGSLRQEAQARVRSLTEPLPTIESAMAAVTVGLAANKRPDLTLSDKTTELIADILDRGLTNVALHAGASETTLNVKVEDRWIFVSLFDDGRGGASVVPGHSLDIIRQGVNRAGGHFSLSSPAERGTLLTIALPIDASLADDPTDTATTPKESTR